MYGSSLRSNGAKKDETSPRLTRAAGALFPPVLIPPEGKHLHAWLALRCGSGVPTDKSVIQDLRRLQLRGPSRKLLCRGRRDHINAFRKRPASFVVFNVFVDHYEDILNFRTRPDCAQHIEKLWQPWMLIEVAANRPTIVIAREKVLQGHDRGRLVKASHSLRCNLVHELLALGQRCTFVTFGDPAAESRPPPNCFSKKYRLIAACRQRRRRLRRSAAWCRKVVCAEANGQRSGRPGGSLHSRSIASLRERRAPLGSRHLPHERRIWYARRAEPGVTEQPAAAVLFPPSALGQ